MSEQAQRRDYEPAGGPPDDPDLPAPAGAQGYADILDDIDDILEENALTFVQNFVQLGGE